ncbi:spermatogenesis-defective protein 39 homolog [Lingula anatina]|uniref:Spermatogenesis-defective protein 39 homolog n=1 Tax=Lingula anatina TaxID=7574 RepID=A0A1S3I7S9_LINAN|nr:spermatogenesis-defective protein 39 homolog [Lingula anatina]|eukprot:XP_013394312.1 spermatogenesis-defective protein 39 homolog [Lingula anatina]
MAATRSRKSFDEQANEEFWASSSIKKQANLFGDDDALVTAKRTLGGLNSIFDDEEDEDVINFDGTPATPAKPSVGFSMSARYKPPERSTSSNLAGSSSLTTGRSVPGLSSASPSSSLSSGLTHSRSASLTVGSSAGTSGLSIDEMVSQSKPKPKVPSAAELAKKEAEINFLKRSVQSAKRERWALLPVKETVRRMLMGESYNLEMYRSREDKLALLDEAIESCDGNAIIAAVLFLKSTLKSSLFHQELRSRPTAISQYLNYLREAYELEDLIDMLGVLNRGEEAAMLKYKQAISTRRPETKVKNLQQCYRTHFEMNPDLAHDASHVQEQISLLERQMPIDKADALAQQEQKSRIFYDFPRKASLINMSVLTTLYYCCFYHYELAENSLASPQAIKKAYHLTEKEFLWTALRALAKRKLWIALETLFQSKSWFGKVSMKSEVGFEKVVQVLEQCGAPNDILSKYLQLVDDPEKRLALGKKFGCHQVVIDTLVAHKDRQQLQAYGQTLTPHTKEMYYAQDALRHSNVKWKN